MIKVIKMTPVEWLEMDLKECIDWDKSFQDTFDKAKEWEFEIIDEFSQWLNDEKYKLSEHTGLWGKYLFAEEKTVKFSELYQIFLKSKEV